MNDLRLALRQLRKHPGFTTVVVLTLALGIGASTTIFSLVKAVLLQPLPFREAQRLVSIWRQSASVRGKGQISYDEWAALSRTNEVFEGVAAYALPLAGFSFPVEVKGQQASVTGVQISDNLLPLLGIRPYLGRTFLPEDSPTVSPVAGTAIGWRAVMLGYGFWQRHFGGDPAVIGQIVRVSGYPAQVVGILGADFKFPACDRLAILVPFHHGFRIGEGRQTGKLEAVVRLKPDISATKAQAAMTALSRIFEREYPKTNAGIAYRVESYRNYLAGDRRPLLLALMGTTGFVLLIGWINITNLLLGRAAYHQKEVAIRAALGAGRGRLMRYSLTESLVLAVLGGGLGLFLAQWGVQVAHGLCASTELRLAAVPIDGAVLGFTAVVSLLSGAAFGALPAWRTTRVNLGDVLKDAGQNQGVVSRHQLSAILITGEVSLALVMLVGSGLLINNFVALTRVDLGFPPGKVFFVRYRGNAMGGQPTAATIAAGDRRLLDRVRALAGVERAATCWEIAVPLLPGFSPGGGLPEISLDDKGASEGKLRTGLVSVGTGYFQTLGIPLKRGRAFTDQDTESGPPVAVVSESLARAYLADRDPIGQRLRGAPLGPTPVTIIGVVGDVRPFGPKAVVEAAYACQVYRPQSQFYCSGTLVVRTKQNPASTITRVLREMESLGLNVLDTQTMTGLVARALAPERVATTSMSFFGLVALILAAVGIYGVVSYSVGQRTREIGIRMALGAHATDVIRLVLGQWTGPIALGIALGLLGAWGLTRLLSGLLLGVRPLDAFSFATAALGLALVALVACYLPARRAAGSDPLVALRQE